MLTDLETDRDAAERGQLTGSAAEVYEAFFVPALFGQFAGPVAEAAGARLGERFLDVACGTGVLARAAAAKGARATGVDCNSGMLAVARKKSHEIHWQEGRAEALPLEDYSFRAVGCQFGLMFFDDRVAALREMWRVLAPGGRMAVAVWDRAETSPGYAAMIALIERLFGATVADALRTPFVLGDVTELAGLFEAAALDGVQIETVPGTARFPSIEDWVRTDVKGWTLADLIDEAGYAELQAAAHRELACFAGAAGDVGFAAPAHVAVVMKRR
ncbi:methyltransferase domain-containing protein [Amaricoccus macauensis]|uniref:methyltransferase domain-containing protein n=1 Tax=Amaricoccus macauensis TaxID=57001 RepID=UPI003C7CE4D7